MNSGMNLNEIAAKTTKKFNTIVIITLLFILVGLIITLLLPKQYKAESKLVLLQKANPNIDSYTAQRSIDSNVNLLIDLVYTDVFFTNVIAENTNIKNLFPENLKDRRTLFARNIVTRALGSGFISVDTYDKSSELALNMNKTVVNKLTDQAKSLLGETANVQIVNQPALYEGVGRPNILVNLFGSAILGFMVGIGYVITRKDNTIIYDFGIEDIVSPPIPDDVTMGHNPILDSENTPNITPDTEYDSNKF
jgi:capsular polysaccharide biosynthesis protein